MALAGCLSFTLPAASETLPSALVRAYVANPVLNAQRAQVRAVDEAVPQAKAGYRPRAQLQADAGVEFRRERGASEEGAGEGESSRTRRQLLVPRGAGLEVEQNLFNGLRTQNELRLAESQVFGARAQLRNSEQNVLLEAATAYMDVLRERATLELQRANVRVLDETLHQVRERHLAGQITPTDVAQAEARLASGRAQVSLAQANQNASAGRFRQVIGAEPRTLAPGAPVREEMLPRSMAEALRLALREHPAIAAALPGVDTAELAVRVVAGELLPTLDVRASVVRRSDNETRGDSLTSASATAQLVVPIYEGGEVYARTRQAKETTGQRRAEVEGTRDDVRAAVVAAWGALDSARAQISAARSQIEAGEVALTGVREEARAGRRTTLDVLNAQQEVLTARVNLNSGERDRVVASFALLAAVGRLSPRTLGLPVAPYSAKPHFDQVKDLWGGLRTPDGR